MKQKLNSVKNKRETAAAVTKQQRKQKRNEIKKKQVQYGTEIVSPRHVLSSSFLPLQST